MDILYKEVPFKLAIENSCKKTNVFPEDRKALNNIIGCSLRHFYVFDNIVNRVRENFSNEEKAFLYLFLTNKLFVSLIPAEQINNFLKNTSITKSEIDKIESLSSDKTKLIPEQYTSDSLEYLHYRYNIPFWAIKMWMKHYKGYVYKIAKSLNRPINHYAYRNTSLISSEDLEKTEGIIKTEFENLYKYEGNVSPSRHSLYRQHKLISLNPAEHQLLTSLDMDVIRDMAFYTEKSSILPLQLMAILSNNYRMDIVSGSQEAFFSIKKELESYPLPNVNLYEANHSSIITCVSKKVHVFFVLPNNTNFAEFKKSPDYFNRVKQDKIDEYIMNQKESILSASDFVEENGYLVYIVPTMDKKETVQISEFFLNKRRDYSLVEHKQFFPFDKYDSCLYYAIFKRNSDD